MYKGITFHLVCSVFAVSKGSCTARKLLTDAEVFGTQMVFFALYLCQKQKLEKEKTPEQRIMGLPAFLQFKTATPFFVCLCLFTTVQVYPDYSCSGQACVMYAYVFCLPVRLHHCYFTRRSHNVRKEIWAVNNQRSAADNHLLRGMCLFSSHKAAWLKASLNSYCAFCS